jgi:hypothetical protein
MTDLKTQKTAQVGREKQYQKERLSFVAKVVVSENPIPFVGLGLCILRGTRHRVQHIA